MDQLQQQIQHGHVKKRQRIMSSGNKTTWVNRKYFDGENTAKEELFNYFKYVFYIYTIF